MAWTYWVPITAQAYMRIDYISQIAENLCIAAADIQDYFHRPVVILPIDTARGEAQQPFPGYLNLVEQNIQHVWNAVPWEVPIAPTRNWLGEWMDTPTFRFSDVNRWFRDVEYLKITVDYAKTPRLVSGAFRSGGTRQQQVIRRR